MIALIVNPVAGTGFALKTLEQLKAELDQRAVDYRVEMTEGPGDAEKIARALAADDTVDAVWSVGGDGTAFETACGLMGTDKPMGIIPAGTGNDFIKTVRIPSEPLAAMEFILHTDPRPVDIGRLGEGSFLNVCGTGFDVTVLDYAAKAKKYCRGMLPYLIGLLQAIFTFKPVEVTMTIDGQERRERLMICSVANGRYIGGGIPICLPAQPDDSKLDAVIVKAMPRWRIPFYLPGLLTGKLLNYSVAEHVRCDSVQLEAKNMRLNVDGEIFSMDEASFGIRPGALKLYW